jgi:hypothetical protein
MRGQRRRGPRRSAQGFFSCPPNRFVGGLRESTKVGRTGFRGGGTQQGNGRQASGRMRYSTSSHCHCRFQGCWSEVVVRNIIVPSRIFGI